MMQDLIDRQAAIDTDGLDEEIRCEMCRNQMHTNRGCDGNCRYDEKLYKKIIQILDKRIKPLPPANPGLTDEEWRQIKQLRSYHNGSYAQVLDKLIAAASQTAIIHCRDCKHYYFADNRIPQEQRYTCDLDGDRWKSDSFCSFAERQEE